MSANDMRSCATCGGSAGAGGNLRRCCGATYYCNATCQKMHRKSHKKLCENTNFSKRKKAVALFAGGASTALAVDDGYDSFGDEESDVDIDNFECPPHDDCPLCMNPLPVDHKKSEYMVCCGKMLCQACSCDHAVKSIERGVAKDIWVRCVFCRSPRTSSDSEMAKELQSNAERGDDNAMFLLATNYEYGLSGLPMNYQKAVELYHRAARLGSADAAHTLGSSYMAGDIVGMDKKKARRLLSRAARGGSIGSLHQLGCMKFQDEEVDFLGYLFTAADLGWKDSMNQLKSLHEYGIVSEEHYKITLKNHLEALRKEQSESRDKMVRIDEERAQRNERPLS